MNPKVVYVPDNPARQIYYIDGDLMLAFEFEYYRKDVLMINIPIEFDESFRKRREEILNFIGKEVSMLQSKPSYYKITGTSIVIQKIAASRWLKSWQIQGLMAMLLLILGIYMAFNGIVLGKEMEYNTHFPRRSVVPITGPFVVIAAMVWLTHVYFKRKKALSIKIKSSGLSTKL